MFSSACLILLCVINGALVDFSSASRINLGDYLTDDKKLEFFGSHEVPEHYIVKTSWPRHRRSEDNIVLDIKYHEDEFQVNLKPTDKNLMAPHTPVWTATSDPMATNGVRYEVLFHNTPKHLDRFRCYQDLQTEAAISIFYDKNNVGTMDGIINKGEGYIIKNSPLREVSHLLKYEALSEMIGSHDINVRVTRSLSQDDEPKNVSTNYHVIFKRPSNGIESTGIVKNLKQLVRREAENTENSVVYPEILVIADYNMTAGKTGTQGLRDIVSYWNIIDLPFSRMTNPKVRLNIGGIILAKDKHALEHLPVQENDGFSAIYDINKKISTLTRTFSPSHPVASSLNLFDVVMIMSSHKLFAEGYWNPDSEYYLVPPIDGAMSGIGQSCPTTDPNNPNRYYPGIGIFEYGVNYYGVDNGVMQLARLLGAHDDAAGAPDRCADTAGFAMSSYKHLHSRRKLDWSPCSMIELRNNLKKPESECLKNEPRWFVLEYNEKAN